MTREYYRNEPSQADIEWQMAGCPEPHACTMSREEWLAKEARINAITDQVCGIPADGDYYPALYAGMVALSEEDFDWLISQARKETCNG